MAEKSVNSQAAREMLAKAGLLDASTDRSYVYGTCTISIAEYTCGKCVVATDLSDKLMPIENYYRVSERGDDILLASDKLPTWHIRSRSVLNNGVSNYATKGSVVVVVETDRKELKSKINDIIKANDNQGVDKVYYTRCKLGSKSALRVTIYSQGGAVSRMLPLLNKIEETFTKPAAKPVESPGSVTKVLRGESPNSDHWADY